MNLKSLIDKIKQICSNIPNVTVVSTESVYDLNNSDISYPAIVITQTSHSLDFTESFMHYGFQIFYAERLLEDKSNMIDNQSTAISVLGALMLQLYNENVIANNATFVPFMERFQALTSGAFANITLDVPLSDCEMSLDEPHCN